MVVLRDVWHPVLASSLASSSGILCLGSVLACPLPFLVINWPSELHCEELCFSLLCLLNNIHKDSQKEGQPKKEGQQKEGHLQRGGPSTFNSFKDLELSAEAATRRHSKTGQDRSELLGQNWSGQVRTGQGRTKQAMARQLRQRVPGS